MSALLPGSAIAYHNIPMELRQRRQWVAWRYEELEGGRITKVPYAPNGTTRASVTDPRTWGDFETVVNASLAPNLDGIGFVLTRSDPYCIIDLDNKPDKPISPEEWAMHQKILAQFDSYTERSVSGRGYHIVVKGKLQKGRRRDNVEVYSSERYMCFTGDVVHACLVAERQALLDLLVAEMPDTGHSVPLHQVEAVASDLDVHEMAMGAANGEKYCKLFQGDWKGDYLSQSEADFALLSMYAFYSRDNEQVRRLFRSSALGKRAKAMKNDAYIDRALRKLRADQPTPATMAEVAAIVEHLRARPGHAATAEAAPPALPAPPAPPAPPALPALPAPQPPPGALVSRQPVRGPLPPQQPPAGPGRPQVAVGAPVPGRAVPSDPSPVPSPVQAVYPPGLVGDLARYFHSTAIRPTYEMAITAAIGITAGVAGRAYNISGTGLNQYLLFIAPTGTGKEAIESGISRLLFSVRQHVPMVEDFVGPSAFASGQGLIRTLDQQPCFVSVLGEFGLQLQALNDPRASGHTLVLRKVILDLYGKSGYGSVLRSTAYSDSERNTKNVYSPAFTIVGESTPETFFDRLNTTDIADGLIPRFHIIEYTGKRPDKNPSAGHAPSPELVRAFANLASTAVATANSHTCAVVAETSDALALLNEFDHECDTRIRTGTGSGEAQLWNRAHLKALKLAGLLAVGVNPYAPVVTVELARWAIEFTRAGTEAVLNRFEIGDFGSGDQKQLSDLRKAIDDYFQFDSKQLASYKCRPDVHAAGLVPYGFFTVRAQRLASFKRSMGGYIPALKSKLDDMVASEQLGRLGAQEALAAFGTRQVLYFKGPSW